MSKLPQSPVFGYIGQMTMARRGRGVVRGVRVSWENERLPDRL